MPGRKRLLVDVDYYWDGKTLVGNSPEGIHAIKEAMEQHNWPFCAELCAWADGSPVNGAIVNFAGSFEQLDKANNTLAQSASVSSFE
ncbi:MAG: hypothetical protein ACD_40C00041G0001 [uncultured bacterium]|nr:MAG: hypothetical protein ACD_40C00041G0001 [uncultured bacterium]